MNCFAFFRVALLGLLWLFSVSSAGVLQTKDQALAELFPGATSIRKELFLSSADKKSVEAAARSAFESSWIVYYEVMESQSLKARVFIDTSIVRTMPETVLVAVSPTASVQTIKILAFHEPPDYRAPARWLDRFKDKVLGDGLWMKRDIDAIAGATLTSWATLRAVRKALAINQLLGSAL